MMLVHAPLLLTCLLFLHTEQVKGSSQIQISSTATEDQDQKDQKQGRATACVWQAVWLGSHCPVGHGTDVTMSPAHWHHGQCLWDHAAHSHSLMTPSKQPECPRQHAVLQPAARYTFPAASVEHWTCTALLKQTVGFLPLVLEEVAKENGLIQGSDKHCLSVTCGGTLIQIKELDWIASYSDFVWYHGIAYLAGHINSNESPFHRSMHVLNW